MERHPHHPHELRKVDEQQEIRLARLEHKVDEIIGRLNGRFGMTEPAITTIGEDHGSSATRTEPVANPG